MRGQYGTEVKVSNDSEENLRHLSADVIVTIGAFEQVFLTPTQARRLAKKLKKHARRVELANTVHHARMSGGYL